MTERQKYYLKLIIEFFVETGNPISSKELIEKYNLEISPATVRHEMNALEKFGFLEKYHISSGRVPSIKGYEYYVRYLSDKTDISFRKKLEDIFAKRRASIDFTLDEAARVISEVAGLTLITGSSNNDELLKSIQLTLLSKKVGTVVLVTSTGRVESKLIEFNEIVSLDDVRIAIRLFKERLINTRLKDLSAKVDVLSPILATMVKNYEALIQAFINKIFDFHNRITNHVYGNNELINKKEIKREDLANLIDLIEKKSIWSSIEGKLDEDETMKISIRPNNTSIISKKINIDNYSREISIVGSNRMNYAEAKEILRLLEKLLGGKYNDK